MDINTPWFEGNLVIIPEIVIGGESYWVELRLVATDLFLLDSYGLNTQSQPGFFFGNDFGDAFDFDFGDAFDFDFGDSFDGLGGPGFYSGTALYDWVRITGEARDIGVGADGTVWVLGTTEREGGYEIFRYTGFGWQKIHGTGVRIDVDPFGNPWVINHDDNIFRLVNGFWQELPGNAKDIGIGADGSVWVIGSDDRSGGYGIYHWDGYGWVKVRGSARQISVGPYGEP